MKTSIILRQFEDRDIDFIFRCKNDEKISRSIVGNFKPFTYGEAEQWVRNCMKGDRPDLKFWAIATNDEERRIVGWVSLSQIDVINRSACFHGIVIADANYKDGIAYREASMMVDEYAFNYLKLNRLSGSCLREHIMSRANMEASLWSLEGVEREGVFKEGKFHDIFHYAILCREWIDYVETGKAELPCFIRRLRKRIKEIKEELLMNN